MIVGLSSEDEASPWFYFQGTSRKQHKLLFFMTTSSYTFKNQTDIDKFTAKSFDSTTAVITTKSTTKPSTTTTMTPTTTTEKEDADNGSPVWLIVTIVISILIFILLCILVIYISRRRILSLRAKFVEAQIDSDRTVAKDNVERRLDYHDIDERYESDEWEIERRLVSIEYTRKLGEGAFGAVYLGRVLAKNIPVGKGRSIAQLYTLTNDNEAVAVKMLHETADSAAERDFLYEIEIVKKIGYYERFVNILACVTIIEPIFLITEYCSNGDLLGFMRQRRKYMLENTNDTDESRIITTRMQILYAIQIAYGMEYLSTRGFVHRDLAARNIMVDKQETCKIGDFGLCREIGNEDENYYSQGGKLPLKWMSPEAIEKYKFSVASDIWSYGILLFEIVTLGGSPYAGWVAAELLNRLKSGDRMDKPDNCTENSFEVLSHCWALEPTFRPTFSQLRKRLAVLLEEVNQNDYYLKLNANANYYVMESNTSKSNFH